MLIKSIIQKIKTTINRRINPRPVALPQEKRYGNIGEDYFASRLKILLPESKIKKNIVIHSGKSRAEIDILIVYNNKLFAIEIKNWKGDIIESDTTFIQRKPDKYTGEIYEKSHKSPFKQLARSVYLLKETIKENPWINCIVFFENAAHIKIKSDNVWFSSMDQLVMYIQNYGISSNAEDISAFFEKCETPDRIYSRYIQGFQDCKISDYSLIFPIENRIITRKDISQIEFSHHNSYDNLTIHLKNGTNVLCKCDNGSVRVEINSTFNDFFFSKIDYIILGDQ